MREIFGIDLPWLLDARRRGERDRAEGHDQRLRAPLPRLRDAAAAPQGRRTGCAGRRCRQPQGRAQLECFGDGIHLFWEGNPKALYEFKDGDKRFVNTYASFEHDSRYSDNVVENAYVDELTNFFLAC